MNKLDELLIYIEALQQKSLCKKEVTIKDICSIYCKDRKVEEKVGSLVIEKIQGKKSVVSVFDIISKINEEFENSKVVSLGETEVLIEYEKPTKHRIWAFIKVFIVCVLIFFGSAFTIMAFNNDISIDGVFEKFYFQMTGKEKPQVSVLEIFYAIGLAAGIIIFFNHIGKKKLSDDVTPIQVEMNKHNKDSYETIIDKVKEKQNV